MSVTTYLACAPFVKPITMLCNLRAGSHVLTTAVSFALRKGMVSNAARFLSVTRLEQRYTLLPQRSLTQYYKTQLPVCNLQCTHLSTKSTAHCANKTGTKASSATTTDLFGEAANLGLFAKFKHMYKKYWYVLIPVHVVTSIGWFGSFYYLSKCGVDVPSLLQYVHLSETIIEKVQGSDMGHYAIAYLCYKVATPLRYAVTLGGTTISIKYLVQAGHIKPMPSKHEIMTMYKEKKLYKEKQPLSPGAPTAEAENNSANVESKQMKKHK